MPTSISTTHGSTTVRIDPLVTDLAKLALPVLIENLITLDRKQQDYGSNNLTKFGVDGVVVRANDKLERIINLRKKSKGKTWTHAEKEAVLACNEPLADSFLDLANYALIGYLMQTAKWPVTTVPGLTVAEAEAKMGKHGEIVES